MIKCTNKLQEINTKTQRKPVSKKKKHTKQDKIAQQNIFKEISAVLTLKQNGGNTNTKGDNIN